MAIIGGRASGQKTPSLATEITLFPLTPVERMLFLEGTENV
jgi:hypothetical protein